MQASEANMGTKFKKKERNRVLEMEQKFRTAEICENQKTTLNLKTNGKKALESDFSDM